MYNTVRQSFVDFFKSSGHEHLPSSPVIPGDDDTLLFVNSGMVQFKNYFLGSSVPSCERSVTVQKCIRAGGKHNDLENVGYTNRHHTFFEMLGNFSFGNYFKEEAIVYAWRFLTEELQLNKDRLYITVFESDEESCRIWKKLTGWGDGKIIKIATNDNFWSMGDEGPCGPCSEIFYDYGDSVPGGKPGTPEHDGPRYTEVWNLVFMQFEQFQGSNVRREMGVKSIDTGMGLERIVSVLEGRVDNYETSLFRGLIQAISDVLGIVYRENNAIAFKVIADHVRSISFLISEGLLPSNEHRGYVLRRIMRRALRYIYFLGCKDVALCKISDCLVSEMGGVYPELRRAQGLISEQIIQEEERFISLLHRGMGMLDLELKKMQLGSKLSGERAFFLYDTFGFPLDMTSEILAQKGFVGVDEKGFWESMEGQRNRSKESHNLSSGFSGKSKGEREALDSAVDEIVQKCDAKCTEFLYDDEVCCGKVLGLFLVGNLNYVVLDRTVIYPESGGQISDVGFLVSSDGARVDVVHSQRHGGFILHATTDELAFGVGDVISAEYDLESRVTCQRAHSATHILHYVLRSRFGDSVIQKGSFVGGDRLRFDFSLSKPLSQLDVFEVEVAVNEFILNPENSRTTRTTSPDEAFQSGAIGLFGEKYGDEVRVVKIGDSQELCGGTHVKHSSEVGYFKIISESSVSSGVRRIEAFTGSKSAMLSTVLGSQVSEVRQFLKMQKASADALTHGGSPVEVFELSAMGQNDLLKEVQGLKSQNAALTKSLRGARIEQVVSSAIVRGDLVFVDLDVEKNSYFDIGSTKDILTAMKGGNSGGLSVCFVSNSKMMSVGIAVGKGGLGVYDAKKVGNDIKQVTGGKGGASLDFCVINNVANTEENRRAVWNAIMLTR